MFITTDYAKCLEEIKFYISLMNELKIFQYTVPELTPSSC